jgi:hypothetical protein
LSVLVIVFQGGAEDDDAVNVVFDDVSLPKPINNNLMMMCYDIKIF